MGWSKNEFSHRLALELTAAVARSEAAPKFNVAGSLKFDDKEVVKKRLSCSRPTIRSRAPRLVERPGFGHRDVPGRDTGTPNAPFTLAVTKEQYVNAKFYY
jgi:hypothetical protein